MSLQITILLVEDDPVVRLVTQRKLEHFGYAVVTAEDGKTAVEKALSLERLDLILMDIDLGEGLDGTEAASKILDSKNLPIVFHTSHTEPDMVERVRCITRYGYVLKESGDFVLQSSIEMALDLFAAHLAQNVATEAYKESESRYRTLFENRHVPMLVLEPESGKIIDANPAAIEFYGYTRRQLTSMTAMQINYLPPEETLAELEKARLEVCTHFLFKHKLASGEIRSVEVHTGPITQGKKVLLYSIIIDINAKTLAEEALARSEQTYQMLFESIPVGIIHFDAQGLITETNPAFTAIIDRPRESLLGLDITQLPDEKVSLNFLEALKGKTSAYQGPYRTLSSQKELFIQIKTVPLSVGGKNNGGIAVIEDLTEEKRRESNRKLIESRLRDEQRLSSIGTLANGIAHEVNNPLMAVINLAQLIVDQKTSEAALAENIIREGNRIASIVHGLMVFASNERYTQTEEITVQNLIEGVTALTGEIIRHEGIKLQLEIDEGLPLLACRPQQIRQVLLNLLTNAKDAIGTARKQRPLQGRIILRCLPAQHEDQPAVRFDVEDNGDGIPNYHAASIFDPFYTTKSDKKGPGLGLSISWGIAREHGGVLAFRNAPEGGCIFSLTIPLKVKTENK